MSGVSSVAIKPVPGKGLGLFAHKPIPRGTQIYTAANRVRMPRAVLEELLQTNSRESGKILLSHGWGEPGDIFVLAVGIEPFVNHDDHPNMKDRTTLRDIEEGEELVEDYHEYDTHEDWYVQLTKEYGVWIAPPK